MKMRSFSDLNPEGKHVLMRVDFNSPIDPGSGRLLDDKRIRGHLESIRALEDAALVLLTHQSRPGKKDFTTLEHHAKILEDLLGRPVEYVDGIFDGFTRNTVRDAEPGDVLLLENSRFYSEEYIEMPPDEASETHLVRRLAPLFDVYINDAFSAAHRSQPSLVGFPQKLTSYPGLLMERELDVLSGVSGMERPRVFSLGGAKVSDAFKVVENLVEDGEADRILLSGVIGNVFMMADGTEVGEPTRDYVEDHGHTHLVERAEELLSRYGDTIEIPTDVAVEVDGERAEVDVDELPVDRMLWDIGVETIARYTEFLRKAETTVVNGPAGVYEEELFTRGTIEVLRAASEARFSVAGGGDTAAAVNSFDIHGFDHVSSGGGASTAVLSGDELPAVDALEQK
ncbi:MAG: phosphoglycerate kinase [Halobacteria archaeon]